MTVLIDEVEEDEEDELVELDEVSFDVDAAFDDSDEDDVDDDDVDEDDDSVDVVPSSFVSILIASSGLFASSTGVFFFTRMSCGGASFLWIESCWEEEGVDDEVPGREGGEGVGSGREPAILTSLDL